MSDQENDTTTTPVIIESARVRLLEAIDNDRAKLAGGA